MPSFIYKGASWTYQEVTALDGRVWMDRNLGASQVATSLTDTLSYGDLFQWGRLDDGHQTPTSGITTTLSSTDIPGNANFIEAPSDWRTPKNDNLWQNGLNVPSPAGWHVPTQAEWAALVTAEGITNYTTAYASALKLTAAGYRNGSNAGLYNQGSYGYYWSSTITGTSAYSLFIYSADVYPGNYNYRAYGSSVRCVKDLATPSTIITGVLSIQGIQSITL